MSLFKFEYQEQPMEQERVALVDGDGTFKIIGIYEIDKRTGNPLTTEKGVPKITLGIAIADVNGNNGFVYDDLTANTGWKIKAVLEAIGLGALYNKNATLDPSNLIKGEGKCEIKFKAGTNGYKDKTIISKYYKADKQLQFNAPQQEPYDDQIPF